MNRKWHFVVWTGALLVLILLLGLATQAAWSQAVAGSDATLSRLLRLPFMRRNHSLVYDAANHRLILFGGWNGRQYFNDVWALDLGLGSQTWVQIRPSGAPPPPRAWHAAVVDTFHHRMLVVGGQGYGGDLGDAWALDLTAGDEAWTELDPAGGFTPRRSMAADYWEGARDMYLFGGVSEGELLDDMVGLHSDTVPGYESWDRPVSQGTRPTARLGATAVWDPDHERLIVFGGADENGNTNDVYSYQPYASPATWTLLTPPGIEGPPPPRRFHSAIFYYDEWDDPAMLVYGGLGDAGFLNDVWKLRLTTPGTEQWQRVSTTGGPLSGRAGHAAAVDLEDNRMYVIGGFGAYQWANNQEWSLDLGAYTWQQLTAGYEWPGLNVSLFVEDAREGVVVHALPESTLAVAVKLSSDDAQTSQDLAVTLSVYGNVLDLAGAWLRDSDGGPEVPAVAADLGNGQYQVSGVDLTRRGDRYERQVVLTFNLPGDVYRGYVPLTAQVEVPGYDTLWQHTGVVHICDHAEALILTNRSLLYERYDEGQVSDLLAGVYEAAQGDGRNDSPTGVVIDVDRYTTAGSWDNTQVNYYNELEANRMASEIRGGLLDFYDRADAPDYLLIVGDDDVIPFYRHYDPTGDEGHTNHDCDHDGVCEHPGWCEDSDTNPAIYATDRNYYFTDDFYADVAGDDWTEGDVELAVGRVVGETPADMLALLQGGSGPGGRDTGRAVLFSLDGWQLGLVPTGNVPDAVPNVLNVPARFTARGFEVRNDDELPRTIDVLYPYSWSYQEFDAILAEGMDLFFLGSGASYNNASAGSAGLYPSTVDRYRIGDDRSAVLLGGSHSGLPVPPPEGGRENDLVLALAQEGAGAVIGPTASSYGSADDLDHCVMAELFAQVFFDELLSPAAGQTAPLGVALRQAKQNYPFGLGSLCGGVQTGYQDEKTVTENMLYGVPWQTIGYPSDGLEKVRIDGSSRPMAPEMPARPVPVGQTASGAYSQTFSVEFTYTVTVSDGWDILTVPGSRLDASDGYPLLPTAEAYTLCLPLSATVTSLQVISDSASAIGSYNIPNVQMLPWDMGGMVYTTTSAVSTLYPSTVITGEQRGRLFIVRAMPIQHNPATGETVFHDRLEVRVAYTAPTPVALCGFRTDHRAYLPGQTMGSLGLVRNVGDAGLILTPTLAIRDSLTRTWSVQVGTPFPLAAGGAAAVPMSATVPLQEGAYRAVLSLWSGGERQAMAVRDFAVLGGRIMALQRSGVLLPGQSSQFHVAFANALPRPVFAFVVLGVFDSAGHPLAELSPQVIAVPGASAATASFDWTPAELPPGDYSAVAWVTAGEEVYGPLSRSFQVRGVYLPLVVRQYP